MSSAVPRVAMVIRSPSVGGHSIEQVFLNHAEHILDFSMEVVELTDKTSMISKLRQLCRYPLIHVTGHVNWVITCLFWKCSILTIHDLGRYRELRGPKRWIYYVWWIALPVFFADSVTVVSTYTRDQLVGICRFAKKKICVIYNSVPAGFGCEPRRLNARPCILQVGTAVHKNAEATIAAMRQIDGDLVLVGKRRTELQEQLRQSGVSSRWLTDIPYEQVLEEYKACDIVAFPTFHEGFGLPVIEAQAVGRPVVTSNVAPLPEVGGEGAIYVDPHDADDLAHAIKSLVADRELWQKMVRRGQDNLTRFEPQAIAGQLTSLYRQVLGMERQR